MLFRMRSKSDLSFVSFFTIDARTAGIQVCSALAVPAMETQAAVVRAVEIAPTRVMLLSSAHLWRDRYFG